MRWPVAIGALALALVAASVHACAAGTAPLDTPWLQVAEGLLGPALLAAPPEAWMDVLAETGSMRAAAEAAEEATARHYGMIPVGDANGDGRQDVVLYERLGGSPLARLTALTASGEELWSLPVDEGENAYVLGDIDRDGVRDITHATVETRTSQDGQNERTTITEHHTVLSGRDLSPILTTTVTSILDIKRQDEGLVFQTQTQHIHLQASFLTARLGSQEAGADVLTFTTDVQVRQARVLLLPQEFSFSLWSGFGMERLDAAGTPLWSHAGFDEEHFMMLHGVRDMDGDGEAELLVGGPPRMHMRFSALPLVGGEPEAGPRGTGAALLLDGATGNVTWRKDLGPGVEQLSMSFVGEIGGGQLVSLSLGAAGRSQVELARAQDGTTVQDVSYDRFSTVVGLGDIDGDGDGDLLVMLLDDHGHQAIVTDGAFTPKWRKNGGLAAIADMDGDGRPEVLMSVSGSLIALDATTGRPLWSLPADKARHSLSYAQDLDGDDGVDLLLLVRSDGEETGDDPGRHNMSLRLLRGADLNILWEKIIHSPAHYKNATAPIPYAFAANAGDLTGNGGHDLVVNLGTFPEIVHEDGRLVIKAFDGPPLNAALAIEGATGRTLLRFDGLPLAEGLDAVPDAMAQIGSAGIELQARLDAPGPAIVLMATVLAALGLALRRRV